MLELKDTLVKVGKAALPALVVTTATFGEPRTSRADETLVIVQASKNSITINIEGEIPTTEHFNKNFRVNNEPPDVSVGISNKNKTTGSTRKAESVEYRSTYNPETVKIDLEGINATIEGSLFQGKFDKDKNVNLKKVIDAPFYIKSFAASKRNDKLTVIGGTWEALKRRGALMVTQNKGEAWQSFEIDCGEIIDLKLTSDEKFAFLYPDNSLPDNPGEFTIHKFDLKDKSIKTYRIPSINNQETVTITTDLYYDPDADAYTQLFGSDKHEGFYAISFYPDGQIGFAKYNIPGIGNLARQIMPFVNKNNIRNVWFTTYDGKILEIQNNKITRVIHSVGEKTALLNNAQIRDVTIDHDNDVAYLATEHHALNTLPGRRFIYTPHIEFIRLTDPLQDPNIFSSPHKYASLLPEIGDLHLSDSRIRISGITQSAEKKYLFVGLNSLSFLYEGIHYKDITSGTTSKEPWKNVVLGFRTLLPRIA